MPESVIGPAVFAVPAGVGGYGTGVTGSRGGVTPVTVGVSAGHRLWSAVTGEVTAGRSRRHAVTPRSARLGRQLDRC
jgi:hypothetical protein